MMMFGDWEAKVYDNPQKICYDLWLFTQRTDGRYVLTHDGNCVRFDPTAATSGDNYFARFDSIEQVQAISEAFAGFGVKTVNDHVNAGLLEATKAHLEDMRSLVFADSVEKKTRHASR